MLKDFNIEKEAGGTGKPIVKIFNATVAQHTLKIHFFYSGKGTTGIPTRGVYGPLISAISVNPSKFCDLLLFLCFSLIDWNPLCLFKVIKPIWPFIQ